LHDQQISADNYVEDFPFERVESFGNDSGKENNQINSIAVGLWYLLLFISRT